MDLCFILSSLFVSFSRVLEELDSALVVAAKGKELFEMGKELVWDELQLTGQCDVFLRFIYLY